VGVFLEDEEIFVGGERPDASSIGIRALRRGATCATFVFLTPLRKHGRLTTKNSQHSVRSWHCLRSEAQEYELHTEE
jgi:hypothetical protein